MIRKTLKSTATKLSHRKDAQTSAENLAVRMKRNVGVASSDLSSPDSSKNPSPGLRSSSSGEEGITKHARKDRQKRGSSKTGRAKTGGNQVQKVKAADGGSTSPLIDSGGTLSSQIQQLFQQSSLTESQSLHAGSAPWAASQYAQTFYNPSPFLTGVRPGAVGQVFFQQAMSNVFPSRYYHSSFHTSAASQLQNKSQLSYDFDVKEGQADFVTRHDCEVLPEKRSAEADSVAVTRTDNTDTSHVLAHWDVGSGREMTTAAGKADAVAEETDRESDPLDDYEKEEYHKKLKKLPRQWELTPLGEIHQQRKHHKARGSHRHQPVEFSIMSYNILSQDLLENHPYLYHGSPSRSLEWRHRRRGLIAEIACHSPDILNLQEVHREHFLEYLKPRLNKLGYVGGYVKRTGDKTDGCATMWKKDKFRLLRSTPVNYCRGGLLDRDNIAIVVELQPIRSGIDLQDETDDKIVVANTHLLFNPRRGDIKLAQLMVLMAEIDRHAYLGPSYETHANLRPSSSSANTTATGRYCPVIMTGDFNMEPHSELYKFMLTGKLDYEGLLVPEISGQEEGAYGRNYLLDRNFFSPKYGVTDFCQYHTAVMNRLKKTLTVSDTSQSAARRGNREGRMSSSETLSSTRKGVNLRQAGSQTTRDSEIDRSKSLEKVARSDLKSVSGIAKEQSPSGSSSLMPINTGRLLHHLNLVTAYRHKIERLGWKQSEVTTHHNRGKCTVDYIFYTVNNKEVRFQHDEVRLRHIRDGKLKLLSRYGLMSAAELDRMGGIPNSVMPSDHLCLIAKFLLK
ncbi:protein angel homolog 2-like isoform X2 [Littorina saxatilis]|uniref:Endonuclease/exonuclease/phosphatase domain-containing protein n=2 Tax=Littorina saxatilis TaxID=31220 RepID=A0AAN9BD18_9CAEN